MKVGLSLEEIKKAEYKIGLKSARMIKKSIIKHIERYNLIGDGPDKDSLLKSVKVRTIMGDVRLFRLSPTMNRHGFILQEGANKRTGHIREIKKHNTFYSVKEHGFMLSRRPFIEEGINNSGAFEYALEELGKLRMKEVTTVFKKSDIEFK